MLLGCAFSTGDARGFDVVLTEAGRGPSRRQLRSTYWRFGTASLICSPPGNSAPSATSPKPSRTLWPPSIPTRPTWVLSARSARNRRRRPVDGWADADRSRRFPRRWRGQVGGPARPRCSRVGIAASRSDGGCSKVIGVSAARGWRVVGKPRLCSGQNRLSTEAPRSRPARRRPPLRDGVRPDRAIVASTNWPGPPLP